MRKIKRNGIYSYFKDACSKKGTSITHVLNECGRSNGNTGSWKEGSFPRLDVAMDIADYLGITLDELCYGKNAKALYPNPNQREWLDIISRIPDDKQQMCKDFISTHAAVPEKYMNSGNGKKSSRVV